MGTTAVLQRVRTARARLVPLMLHANDSDIVLLPCTCRFICDQQRLAELSSSSRRTWHAPAESSRRSGSAGSWLRGRRSGWQAPSARSASSTHAAASPDARARSCHYYWYCSYYWCYYYYYYWCYYYSWCYPCCSSTRRRRPRLFTAIACGIHRPHMQARGAAGLRLVLPLRGRARSCGATSSCRQGQRADEGLGVSIQADL
jgi:hypothetical protein